MLNYMGSTVKGVKNLFRLYCTVDVTNINILKLCEIHIDLICPDKIWSIIILIIILGFPGSSDGKESACKFYDHILSGHIRSI